VYTPTLLYWALTARRAALRPQRLDLLVLEGVVQVHVVREDIFDFAAVARPFGDTVGGRELRLQLGEASFQRRDPSGVRRRIRRRCGHGSKDGECEYSSAGMAGIHQQVSS
jgi:hypothetical protein